MCNVQLKDLVEQAEQPLREYLDVPVEGLLGVRVRSLTEREAAANDAFVIDPATGRWDPDRAELQTAHLLWLSLVDKNGKQCYALEQLEQLSNLPEWITRPIHRAIADLRNRGQKKSD